MKVRFGPASGQLSWLHQSHSSRQQKDSVRAHLFLLFNGNIVTSIDGLSVRLLLLDSPNRSISVFPVLASNVQVFTCISEDPQSFISEAFLDCCLERISSGHGSERTAYKPRLIGCKHASNDSIDPLLWLAGKFSKVTAVATDALDLLKEVVTDALPINPNNEPSGLFGRRNPWIPERILDLDQVGAFVPGNPIRKVEECKGLEDLKGQIFKRGITASSRSRIWPLLFAEQSKVSSNWNVDALASANTAHHLDDLIERDVRRLNLASDGIDPELASQILWIVKTWCLCSDQDYVQGMCDLTVPLVHVFGGDPAMCLSGFRYLMDRHQLVPVSPFKHHCVR